MNQNWHNVYTIGYLHVISKEQFKITIAQAVINAK